MGRHLSPVLDITCLKLYLAPTAVARLSLSSTSVSEGPFYSIFCGFDVNLLFLDQICDVNGSGKLSCGEHTGTGSSTTTLSPAESSSTAPISTAEIASASSGSKDSSVDSHSSTERPSGQSSNPGPTSASDVMTTSAAMSASTDTSGSCGGVEKRMRIMNR